jgi:hypothetical protein
VIRQISYEIRADAIQYLGWKMRVPNTGAVNIRPVREAVNQYGDFDGIQKGKYVH